MDGYHFFKYLKEISKKYPKNNVKVVILDAITKDDRIKAYKFIQGIAGNSEDIHRFGSYLFGNWKSIRNLIKLEIP